MNYKDIKIKNDTNRYTEEFKDAVRQLIREGKTYKEVADLFELDSINSGFRQLIYKLQREVFHSIDVKQLKANNTNTEDSAVNTESSVATKSDKVILSVASKALPVSGVVKPTVTTSKEVKKSNSSDKVTMKNSVLDEVKKQDTSVKALQETVKIPTSNETIKEVTKEHKTVENSTAHFTASQDIISLVSSIENKLHNTRVVLEAKKQEVTLLESTVSSYETILNTLKASFK